MEIIIVEDKDEASRITVNRIQKQIAVKRNSVLGLATGATPDLVYKMLIDRFKQGLIDFSDVRAFNLDEYVGVAAEHKASYSHYMVDKLFSHINIKTENHYIPNGCAENINMECLQYEEKINEIGPIDLQILGIGCDGHIGFNEPMSSLRSRTRLKTLTESTRRDNSKYFGEDLVPWHVITMGIGTILEAKEILLLAFGEEKAEAVSRATEGPLMAMVPASALQLHEKVKVIVDKAAASRLKNQDYYRWVYSKKPAWQKQELDI